ncbi:MAG: hypothetical protein A2161_00595 [Candidatus Schekmanbacteria bacterium RBG_13_48_7]|uniref:Flagellar assembly factor FliW n=1 Tax=Candidatus Schekmanbacteria bacterium RBG_13_48_7 TaxID=1817878 RepID=A0A1F7RLY3_9BACT|nr:MAG: hypothetical protein A2161_00595 [Candidatus Schekmanbacteria bacterium RBG_13_48_7]
MQVNSYLFGDLIVEQEKIIQFPEGVFGFPDKRRYILVEKEESFPISWLQCLDDPYLSFAVINPFLVFSDYKVVLDNQDCEYLELNESEGAMILSIMILPEDLNKSTINLQAPLIINIQKRLGRQVILSNQKYPYRHPVFFDCEEDNNCETTG